jgi:hypothetical protein
MRATIGLLVSVIGCTSGSPLRPGSLDAGRGTAGADGGMDRVEVDSGGSACAALSACDCLAAGSRCMPVATACWCDVAECGGGACICGGGSFVACEPAGCPSVSCGLGALAPPDGSGCRICDPTPSCSSALAHVQAACAATPLSAAAVGALCAGTGVSCVANCLANLGACAEIAAVNCSYCAACDCATPPSALLGCVQLCMSR